MADETPTGEVLAGGNMNAVVRQGDTVLRVAGPWTPTVHRFLSYLACAGVGGIPLPLGVEGSRERLSFVDADVPVYPLPDHVFTDEALVEGARLLRRLHDASIGFGLDGAVWQAPAKVPSEVICHNDFSPHNLAYDAAGHVVGAIDFDFASPGPRLWDLAYYATRAVPLTDRTPPNAPGMTDAERRVRLLLDAYGSEATWSDVLRVAIIRLHDLADMSRDKTVELGNPRLADDADGYEREAAYLATLRD
ncbi:aminoglycoside phosphotransferase family protein [Frigoribacterium sp. PhB118]|uniref:aminoglycoside phosphotransferase family protein n=1 Tax=Frigoribacterium sp. PhB118 TaxID=2485175 RepID=UPI000F488F52|nr:aminoglycoside phosphotransferase family protein [Frigoribacterium sp. PhB118]ROS49365.1 phosphotransferase family enzyme [Frigoribacterium sp. PhB118]